MDNIEPLLKLVNQFFELEKKIIAKQDYNSFNRNFDRIKESFANMGLIIHNPEGEKYNETRTDCEASLAGSSVNNLIISEVIKPSVYLSLSNHEKHLIQRAVVIVEERKK